MLNEEKAQQIMTEAIERLINEAGVEYARAVAIRHPDLGTSMVMVTGSKESVDKTVLLLDPKLNS